jgi:DNA helicase Pif1-like protein
MAVNNMNIIVLNNMPGTEVMLYNADSIKFEAGADSHWNPLLVKYFRSLDTSSLPQGELHVKPSCPLILLRNLAPGQGLCNGTRMVLKATIHHVLQVQILGGIHNGELAFIPQITLIPSSQPGYNFKLCHYQFPVHLAFSLTINKAQGQSVCQVGLNLQELVFSHGQLYIALSHAMSCHHVKILLPSIAKECYVFNVMYK